jgi:cyclopropane fatty-acyl-phospholipid synthase-like methyltransferase
LEVSFTKQLITDGWEVKGYRTVMQDVEWNKIKYNHSKDTWNNPFEHNLNTADERQDCKIGKVCF